MIGGEKGQVQYTPKELVKLVEVAGYVVERLQGYYIHLHVIRYFRHRILAGLPGTLPLSTFML